MTADSTNRERIKLAIGLPAYTGTIVAAGFRMWLRLGAALVTTSDHFQLAHTSIIETCGIDVARNRLVADALAADADWLLMIDADTWHDDAGDILGMIADAAQAHTAGGDIAAIAAQVPRRDPNDTHLMVYTYVDGKRHAAGLPSDGVGIIDSAATAMMAVNLGFIRARAIKPPWFKFEWQQGDIKPALSEDLYFCELMYHHCGVILGDGRFIAKHLQRPTVIGGAGFTPTGKQS